MTVGFVKPEKKYRRGDKISTPDGQYGLVKGTPVWDLSKLYWHVRVSGCEDKFYPEPDLRRVGSREWETAQLLQA